MKNRLTKETFETLTKELEQLETELPGAIIAKREASLLGDLNENFEYDAAVRELDRIYARITEINKVLKDAEVITEISADKIGLGSYFTVTLMTDGKANTNNFRLVEKVHNLEAIQGEYKYTSVTSPFGKAVYGKTVGEAFEYVTPNHKRVTGEVVSILTNLNEKNYDEKKLVK